MKIFSSAAAVLLVFVTLREANGQGIASRAAVGEPAPVSSKSGLTWDKQEVEMDSKLGGKIVRTSYRFTNSGNHSVSIIDVTPSCSCVATELAKLDYAPGESGLLKVTLDLTVDDDDDLQDRSILVTSSDAPQSPAKLRFVVHVARAVDVKPQVVTWRQREEPVAKEVLVKAGPEVKEMKLRLESENGDFSLEIKPEIAGQSYRVIIVPHSTSAVCYAQLRLLAESPSFPRTVFFEVTAKVIFGPEAVNR